MDDDFIVTTFVVFDKTMAALGHRDQVLAQASDAEVLTVAVVAARYFQNHLERALQVMRLGRYLSGALSVSRCNRRLHRLRAWLLLLPETLGAVFAAGAVFLIDSLPVPVCRRARARRCRKVRGKAYCGVCHAKRERFFGWRLHLVCAPAGVPVACDLGPGGLHDLTPVHELPHGLPAGSTVYGDKGDNAAADEATILADTDVRLVPIRQANMAMGVQRLRARTNPGLELKLHASLLAATIANAD